MPIVPHKSLRVEEPYPSFRSCSVVNKGLGSESVTALKVDIGPGGQIPMHTHPGHEEAIIILEGTATTVMENETRAVEAPATMLVPQGVRHQIINTGTTPLHILAIFPTVDVTREWV